MALGGICLALTLIFMFGGAMMPGIELTLFAISSVFVAVMVIESGVSSGLIPYIAAVVLGLILVPNKVGLVPYIFLFGYYGLVKYFIEKRKTAKQQITLKVIFFAAVMCIGFLGFKELLLGAVDFPDYPIAIIIVGGVIMMLLYDYIYTIFINIYINKIKKQGRI